MMRTSPRVWVRIEAAAITVVLILGVAAVVIRDADHGEPSFGALPPPAHVVPRHPVQPAATAPNDSGGSASGFVPTRYQQRAPSTSAGSSHAAPAPRGTRAPSHPPSPSDGFPWTQCRSTGAGALACSGGAGSFTCATASSGTTTCTGSGVSFTCSTDAQTGARGCDGGQSRWQCGADPLTGDTNCGGTTGAYNCAAQPGGGVAEECSGSHTFYCYGDANDRLCRGAQRSDPSCYFEPAFGAYCRD